LATAATRVTGRSDRFPASVGAGCVVTLACEHLVHRHRERVLIGSSIDARLRHELLGRHVPLRADPHVGGRKRLLRVERIGLLDDLGDAEVAQKRPPEGVEEDVRGLHVAVHHALGMHVVERRGNGGQPEVEHAGCIGQRLALSVPHPAIGE
jgi:hypothetical protein